MIGGRIGVVNYHSVSNKSVGDTIEVCQIQGKISNQYIGKIKEIKSIRDVCIFELNKEAPQFADIRTHIVKINQVEKEKLKGCFAWLVKAYPDGWREKSNVVIRDIVDRHVNGHSEPRPGLTYGGHKKGVAWDPPGVTEVGDCGSPVLLLNASQQRKLIAIHSAGNDKDAFGVYIFCEDFDKYFEDLKNQAIGVAQDPEVEENLS